MKKNSLILEIKNDLNKIRKDLDITLEKLAILESMIELEERLVTLKNPVVESCIVENSEKESVQEEPIKELIVEQESVKEPVVEEQLVIETVVEESTIVEVQITDSVLEESAPIEEVQEYRNLMSVIGLNDRFRFRHDLFSNSDDVFRETIQILNTIEKFSQAVDYLNEKFGWDQDDATVVYFYEIIKPKFSK
jgi:hypothetical protein